ncbi:phosphocarrier, HPr family [Rubrobacter radiotolerans]|uniref:Phosphocarrier protein HPr n=1 Tax=Rubrobacter radiotolerans TaxID=42256 RepID=A0A023X4K8_RUBRA|nr:HPr family phosphocarrier protein [Rubrobacter radiotolerans]AHY46935.1 phosphocarrier, HPr family [Rubrobacter radiotolerans]MDX5894340.1 HPr family phosphocarrier protein [Rubrobacter radiotolerans]SMC05773.1 phosphocarrier protein HPr [Rubrobacter radiotolerans DSM 5868]
MVEREVVVVPEAGIHARPISNIVKAAKGFSSDVTVSKGEREASAKSSMRLMTLGAKKGDTVLVRAEGDDEEAALEAVVEIISTEEE